MKLTTNMVQYRKRQGWTEEQIREYYKQEHRPVTLLSRPTYKKRLKYGKLDLTYREWADLTGLTVITIDSRVNRDWPVDAVLGVEKNGRLEEFLKRKDNFYLWWFIGFVLGYDCGSFLIWSEK